MGQVIIEIGEVPVTGRASLQPITGAAEEIDSTTSNQATTIVGNAGQVCSVTNNGDADIWVNGGAAAAVETGRFVPIGQTRDFLFTGSNQTVNVIEDS